MGTVLKYVIGVVIVGILISTTASEIRVNDKTDFTLLKESKSFWTLIIIGIIYTVFAISKSYLTKKYKEYLEELEEKLVNRIEKNIQTKVTRNVKSSLTNTIKSEIRKEAREIKRDVKEENESKLESIIETSIKPIIIVEVRKEIDIVQNIFTEKIELTVLKHFMSQQKPNQKEVSIEELFAKYVTPNEKIKVGVE